MTHLPLSLPPRCLHLRESKSSLSDPTYSNTRFAGEFLSNNIEISRSPPPSFKNSRGIANSNQSLDDTAH